MPNRRDSTYEKVLAIIPARGGSRGVPKKNIRPLNGRPVISYVIEAAKKAVNVDYVLVSTDSLEIAGVARAHGADVVIRPAEMASDTAPIDLALRHALIAAQSAGQKFGLVAWLQANVPTTRPEVIDRAISLMKLNPETSAVQTVVPYRVPPQWAWILDGDNMVEMEGCYSYTVLRQEAKPAYHADGAVNVMRSRILLETEGQLGQAYFGSCRKAVVQEPTDSIEIDEPIDLLFCEFLMQLRRVE